jgi:hypothetical protein
MRLESKIGLHGLINISIELTYQEKVERFFNLLLNPSRIEYSNNGYAI